MNKAQATLEFTLAFIMTILFIVFTFNVFAWFNRCMVDRQVAYEDSRSIAGGLGTEADVGKTDFYNRPALNVFNGGIDK